MGSNRYAALVENSKHTAGSSEFYNYVALCRRWKGADIECVYGDARHTSKKDVSLMARVSGFRVVEVLSRADVDEIKRGNTGGVKTVTVEFVRENFDS